MENQEDIRRKMNEDRRDKIVRDHPLLFAITKHFECGDGWLDIIEDLANKLEPLIEKYKEENEPDYKDDWPCATQIKEKYGSLRFYMTSQTDEMDDLIEEAEKASKKTCENCGKEGKIGGQHWFTCACDECWSKMPK